MIKICQYDKNKLALLEIEFAYTNNDFFLTYGLYKLDYCLSLYKRDREEWFIVRILDPFLLKTVSDSLATIRDITIYTMDGNYFWACGTTIKGEYLQHILDGLQERKFPGHDVPIERVRIDETIHELDYEALLRKGKL